MLTPDDLFRLNSSTKIVVAWVWRRPLHFQLIESRSFMCFTLHMSLLLGVFDKTPFFIRFMIAADVSLYCCVCHLIGSAFGRNCAERKISLTFFVPVVWVCGRTMVRTIGYYLYCVVVAYATTTPFINCAIRPFGLHISLCYTMRSSRQQCRVAVCLWDKWRGMANGWH